MQLPLFALVVPWVVVVAAGCWLGHQIVRQNGRILLRLKQLEQRLAALADLPGAARAEEVGLPVGSPAPAFALPDLDGRHRTMKL
jgi:hypothetical protein